ncbi:methylenetetrahydrofolate reductase [NAD(P)H] [Treponema brennaborense]|uniref:Methylenetetrahydrofolate reductase n=1 Tax=Treponema brennaborense (strain DSM 12168 / CIP 105900 / DD5/3) TaxID=906968 RepID=F4LLK8_TREBD|nr:methylenetetrahydrofolate reductase [NAD(P)H] [Treponema brennaborense]AEE16672.1 5,10-methylenetetrahydrofolate reductase [Treponema brennaborense DSM 12168]
MKLSKLFKKGRQSFSFEIFPPKHDEALRDIGETLDILAGCSPDFISVTFGAGGSETGRRTIDLAKRIKNEYALEPLVHLTCLNGTEAEVEGWLHELEDAGIENVLALRGDRRGEAATGSRFSYASDLVSFIRTRFPSFCVAGACYPESHPESPDRVSDVRALADKVRAGTDFLISQLFFENGLFSGFCERCRIAGITVPVAAGIMPVVNKKQIEKMTGLCGASVPPQLARILDRYGDNPAALRDAGLAYAENQIVDLAASGADGIHLYTMNNPAVAKQIAEGIKNILPHRAPVSA